MSVAQHILLQGRMIGGGGEVPVPLDVIVMWSGVLGAIPANWNLCDGTGTTPILVAKFLEGSAAAADPGGTGGSDTHTHTSMTANGGHTHTAQNEGHSHTVNTGGAHHHSLGDNDARNASSNAVMHDSRTLVGGHQHDNNSVNHSHTMSTPANHTHVISTDDGRPPFYELAFLQAAVGALVAANLIIIWTGALAAIPAGWSLCDGGGARPDMRGKFVRGINTAITNPGGVGGNATHLHTETAQVAHTHSMNTSQSGLHTFDAYNWLHNHNIMLPYDAKDIYTMEQGDSGSGLHTHANSNNPAAHDHDAMGNDGGHAHVVNTASSLPAYYDVAFIFNDGGAVVIPASGIVLWVDVLANIPAGYNQCDGGGGRPELRSKFIRGSNAAIDPGGLGGSDTHTHTDIVAGAHNGHSMVNTGAHTHNNTDTIGSHKHSEPPGPGCESGTGIEITTYGVIPFGGDHFHTYNNEGDHVHTLTDPGNHVHNPWSTDNRRPAYYEIAYIMKA